MTVTSSGFSKKIEQPYREVTPAFVASPPADASILVLSLSKDRAS